MLTQKAGHGIDIQTAIDSFERIKVDFQHAAQATQVVDSPLGIQLRQVWCYRLLVHPGLVKLRTMFATVLTRKLKNSNTAWYLHRKSHKVRQM